MLKVLNERYRIVAREMTASAPTTIHSSFVKISRFDKDCRKGNRNVNNKRTYLSSNYVVDLDLRSGNGRSSKILCDRNIGNANKLARAFKWMILNLGESKYATE